MTVPPEEPKIFDAQGKEISHIAGPFREGHELFLSCQVTGGEYMLYIVNFLILPRYVRVYMYIHI